MEQPLGIALDIIELRAYARAKQAVEQQQEGQPEPQGEMVGWVWQVQHQLAEEHRAEMAAREEAKRSG